MKRLKINLSGFTKNVETRLEILHNIEYIVAGVTMIVEGVLPGSAGPILYTANEIELSVSYWDGVPVTINHPTDANGQPTSARIPSVIEEFGVGQIYNTTFDSATNSLKAEAWINKTILETKFPEVYASIIADDSNMEVSTGVFFDERGDSGTFNNTQYDTTAYSCVGDHLALLPTATGACSWQDGCGLRTNSSAKKAKQAFFNELSYQDTSNALSRYVDSLDDNSYYYYVDRTYDNYFTFKRIEREAGRLRTLWKQSYTKNNDIITPTGDPQRVTETRVYTVISADAVATSGIPAITNETNKTQKESEMANDKPCCPEKVKSLIAAKTNSFDETHEEMLSKLNEKELESMVAMNEDLVANSTEKETGGEEVTISTKDFIKDAPDHIKNEINGLLDKQEAEKQEIIANILKDENCTFDEKELNAFNVDVLVKMAGLGKKETPEQNADLQTNLKTDMSANSALETKAIIPGDQETLSEERTLKTPRINWKE